MSAVKLMAGKMKVALPADVAIDAEVDLGAAGAGCVLAARLNVSLPGVTTKWPSAGWKPHTRFVHIPVPHMAISKSQLT